MNRLYVFAIFCLPIAHAAAGNFHVSPDGSDDHPFKAVADMLGHRHLSTTFIYTQVGFNALGQVTLPWPEEVVS